MTNSAGLNRWTLMLAGIALSPLVTGCGADAGPPAWSVTAIESPAADGSGEPNLSVSPRGDVHLTWIEPAGEGHALRFARLNGGAWDEPRTIARGEDWFVNWADFPSITSLPDGRLAAHYLQRHAESEVGYHYDIRIVQSVDNGVTWSSPIEPHRGGVPAEHGFVSLFTGPGDSLAAIWLDGRKSHERYGGTNEMTLRYTTVASDGALGDEVEIDGRICDCCQTSVAIARAGPVAVYRDRTEDEVRDIYITRYVDGRWTPGVPVHDDGWRIDACPVNGPAADAVGDTVVVAWFTAAGDEPRVNVAFSVDGGASFGGATRIDGGEPIGRVDVALLESGSAMVVWLEHSGEAGADVRGRELSISGELSRPMTVARSSGERASGFPRMVRAGERLIAAWTGPAPRVHTVELVPAGRR